MGVLGFIYWPFPVQPNAGPPTLLSVFYTPPPIRYSASFTTYMFSLCSYIKVPSGWSRAVICHVYIFHIAQRALPLYDSSAVAYFTIPFCLQHILVHSFLLSAILRLIYCTLFFKLVSGLSGTSRKEMPFNCDRNMFSAPTGRQVILIKPTCGEGNTVRPTRKSLAT